MSLFDLHREYDQPQAPPVEAQQPPDQPQVSIPNMITRSGRRILITTAPLQDDAITAAQKAGLPAFTWLDMPAMKDLTPEVVDLVIAEKKRQPTRLIDNIILDIFADMAQRVFPGSTREATA